MLITFFAFFWQKTAVTKKIAVANAAGSGGSVATATSFSTD